MIEQGTKKRTHYSEEFKRDAVELLGRRGSKLGEVARGLGNSTDDAGHAVGQNLGGPGGVRSGNIFPQNPSINRGDFRDFEKEIAARVLAGDTVYVRIIPQYQGLATRPYKIVYQVRINGQTARV